MRLGLGLGLGAGGVGLPTFDPLTIANCKLDLWASSGVTQSGTVSAWADRSASAANAAQATAGTRPAYNATGIGGRPAIVFASGKNLDGSMNLAANDWTIFVVHDPDTAASTTECLMDWAIGRLIVMHTNATSGQVGYFDGAAFRDAGAASAAPQVACYRLNSTGGNSAAVRVNGSNVGTGMSYTQRALGSTQKIGSDYVGTSQYSGKIGRIVIYQGNLSLTDVQTIERGLGRYYNITVA